MTTTTEATRGGARVRIQRFGTLLSNMIMPSIGAIIAWGLITAFFIPDGWTPNEKIATVVGPTIFYVLPTLIAYTGGMIVYGVRGGVVGATSLIGVIMATSDPLFVGDQGGSPMFLGAMIMGPLTAYLMKRADALWHHKIKPGFEMLVNNFSAGILAAVMVVFGMFAVAPVLRVVMGWLGDAVNFLVDNGLLPLTSLFIEPAKVLFLNNAINHGVLTPLGIDEAAETGKSVLFLLEANPGPGLGLLLAYSIFGRGVARATAPGAAIIQFFGGIHEVYFPFVLMKPKMILATIAGGMTGIFLFTAFEVGLRAPAAPGSIFAVYAQTPGGDFVGITAGVFGAAAVSFLVAAVLLRLDHSEDEGDLVEAASHMESMKGKESAATAAVLPPQRGSADSPINSIVFACDAGMGSSAMGASVLRRKITEAGFSDVTVVNQAISNLSDEYDLVVVHADLSDRAHERTPSAALVTVDNFMSSPRYDEIVTMLHRTNKPAGASTGVETEVAADDGILPETSVVLSGSARNRDDAITEAGRLLVEAGAVDPAYVDAMHERERSVSTAMGSLLAIPHGTNEAKDTVHRTALSFVRYDDELDWSGKPVKFVVGIAGAGKDHLPMLGQIARVFSDPDKVAQLEGAQTAEEVQAIVGQVSRPPARS
ncbi:MAG TPA: PTS mannitol transporter subunit IICBA [Nocardioidaceae bacterium]|nr:PTS mannitol transporter subunit IICBA [Nocardioidaceae bacterium]